MATEAIPLLIVIRLCPPLTMCAICVHRARHSSVPSGKRVGLGLNRDPLSINQANC
jgi:hypothetical protein